MDSVPDVDLCEGAVILIDCLRVYQIGSLSHSALGVSACCCMCGALLLCVRFRVMQNLSNVIVSPKAIDQEYCSTADRRMQHTLYCLQCGSIFSRKACQSGLTEFVSAKFNCTRKPYGREMYQRVSPVMGFSFSC